MALIVPYNSRLNLFSASIYSELKAKTQTGQSVCLQPLVRSLSEDSWKQPTQNHLTAGQCCSVTRQYSQNHTSSISTRSIVKGLDNCDHVEERDMESGNIGVATLYGASSKLTQKLTESFKDDTEPPANVPASNTQEPGKTILNFPTEDEVQYTSSTHARNKHQRNIKAKKIREKHFRKWKPFELSNCGFTISRTPRSLDDTSEDANSDAELERDETGVADNNEPTQLTQDIVNNEPTQLTQDIVNHEPTQSTHDIASSLTSDSEQDDVAYFHALGIDVLNYEHEFLDWDGVHVSQLPCPLSKAADLKQTNSVGALKQTRVLNKKRTLAKMDTVADIPSPSVACPQIKKSDRYTMFELECSSSQKMYIRRDKDRRLEKPHKAIKSKNCHDIFRNIDRKRRYMHHRLVKMHNLNLEFRNISRPRPLPPMPKSNLDTEVAKQMFRADRKVAREPKTRPAQNLRHALDASNCPQAQDGELTNFLISLQHREMTPEDYDMLLRLDDGVKPKTVSDLVLRKLRTEKIGPTGPEVGTGDWQPLCTICMEPYLVGQERKFLPCSHDFHSTCIDTWLTNSSLNCPLDGLPIESS